MVASQPAAPRARVIRLIHGALVTGVVAFLLVTHFGLRPASRVAVPMSPTVVNALLGVALAAFAVGLMLRRLVPRPATDESMDAYWARATGPAIISWAPLELGSLSAVVAYMQSGNTLALSLGVLGVVIMAFANPGSLERR